MTAWPTAPLAEVADIVSGATPKTGTAAFWDGDIQWATPKDLSTLQGPYIRSTPRTITAAGLASCGANLLPAGSVLFSSRAPIGHVAINTVPMATNQGFKSFVPKADRLDAKYLFHWLRAHRAYLENLGNGATFKEVSKAVVSRVEVLLPPIEEQRRIAAILDQADALRAKRREALALLDDLTQSIFTDMFAGIQEACALGALMSDAAVFRDGDWVESKDQDPAGTVRLTQLADVGEGRWLDKSARFLTQNKAVELRCTFLRKDDVLVARMPDPLGRACLFPGSSMPCVTVVDVAILRPSPAKVDPVWLAACINSAKVRRQIASYATGTTRNRISRGNLSKVRVPVVPLTEQRRFRRRIESVSEVRFGLERASALTSELFEAAQARAFSGRL